MREVRGAEDFKTTEEQHQSIPEREDVEVVPVAPECRAVQILVQQDTDAVPDQHTRQQRDPERQREQNPGVERGEREQAAAAAR